MSKEAMKMALSTLTRCLGVREIPQDLWLDISRACKALETEIAKPEQGACAKLDSALVDLLYAVGRSVENGAATWEVEDAYEAYEKAESEANRRSRGES